ncbi:prokaryotic E2 ligase family D protein [Sphingobacterium lactis]|uniref:prokaryotic E2 ligase family D protein n=1 Tax=Sphingobacterium TaxID=28453 RepID=UPI0021A3C00E|nr:prokaryotic E2 ligase family D protein [Sphingobacterium hotanense]MCT1526055.1 prokaryotic E2 ligase family D protein [Sphingobacterium hotanense]
MKNYKNITPLFSEKYRPVKALVAFSSNMEDAPTYVESYDLDENGYPINAHPLTVRESIQLRKSLQVQEEKERSNYLTPKGIMPDKVLHIDYAQGQVVWYTTPQRKKLFFTESIGLTDGEANVPAIVWKASKSKLAVWALGSKQRTRPKGNEPLYKAPFFNLYDGGSVCMGNVETFARQEGGLEFFMDYWEAAFWNSTFSHLNVNTSPVKGNVIQLWESLLNKDRPFPTNSLISLEKKLNKIF